jgi:hypothetical protein
MGMDLEEICDRLSERGVYSARLEDGLVRIGKPETGSEYILEAFEKSAQIRQAVWLDRQDLSEDDLGRLHLLCSAMNARFSGCKSYVDPWGVLITGADILSESMAIEFIEMMLNQVEFISITMLDLVETQLREQRLVSEEEIDSALEVPPLH